MDKCFYRYIGQIVWDEIILSIGPFRHIGSLGMRKGIIVDIRKDPKYPDRLLHDVKFTADIDWFTGEPVLSDLKEHQSLSKSHFDYGLRNIMEIDILLNGGLLSSKGNYYDEPQPSGDRWTEYLAMLRLAREDPNLEDLNSHRLITRDLKIY